MNTLLIVGIVVGLIAVIALVSYFMLGGASSGGASSGGATTISCSESIDGKYGNNLDELFVIVGQNQGKVLIMMKANKQSGGTMMAPAAEFQIQKAVDPITIDNKKTDVYMSVKPVFNMYYFLARNPTTCGLSFYKMGATGYEKLPDMPTELRKVE